MQGREIRISVPGPPEDLYEAKKLPVRMILLIPGNRNHMDQAGRKI